MIILFPPLSKSLFTWPHYWGTGGLNLHEYKLEAVKVLLYTLLYVNIKVELNLLNPLVLLISFSLRNMYSQSPTPKTETPMRIPFIINKYKCKMMYTLLLLHNIYRSNGLYRLSVKYNTGCQKNYCMHRQRLDY